MSTQNFEQLMNMYGNIKFFCGIAALIFLLAAIALFFLLRIPSVFSELTGRGAKKAIEEMTAANESGGLSASRKIGDDGRRHKRKRAGTSRLRKNTGRLTGSLTGNLTGNPAGNPAEDMATGRMDMASDYRSPNSGYGDGPSADEFMATTSPIPEAETGTEDTSVLFDGMSETSVLSDGMNETSVLDSGANETSVLDTGMNETTVMRPGFIIERSIVEIHTDEMI
ncbi:hypothetical protein [Frisingicoccus sp.]|uniref:hypothetical protein n=1 Tax=Frisingicoccus sp. TaxID=1918627 RepID=UPI003AB8F738